MAKKRKTKKKKMRLSPALILLAVVALFFIWKKKQEAEQARKLLSADYLRDTYTRWRQQGLANRDPNAPTAWGHT